MTILPEEVSVRLLRYSDAQANLANKLNAMAGDPTAATYAIARTLVGTAGSRLQVLGRTTQSDGGQGLFTWVQGGTTSVDDGYRLQATGGVWTRDVTTGLQAQWFAVVGDGATDNTAPINKWIAAAQELVNAGNRVYMILNPGVYWVSGVMSAYPGEASVEFRNAQLVCTAATGSVPFMVHGRLGTGTNGNLYGIDLSTRVTHKHYNRNFIGLQLLNKYGAYNQITSVGAVGNGFTIGVQFACDAGANGQNAYNTFIIGQSTNNHIHTDFCVLSATGTPFSSENALFGGNISNNSSWLTYGNSFGMCFSRMYDTGYSGNSGNYWYKPSFQLGYALAPYAQVWAGTTAYATDSRIYGALTGAEWLVKVGGTSGSAEPTTVPAGATNIANLTAITTTAGSAIITMASTAAVSALTAGGVGAHLRGTNPLNAFPLNTYVQSVDSGTQITLTQPCAPGASSTTYKATFITPVTDGSCTLVYLGQFLISPVWLRDSSTNNGVRDARAESGAGEPVVISGAHLFPQSASVSGSFDALFETKSVTVTNIAYQPLWKNATAYLEGDQVRRATIAGFYWECLHDGTSGGSEPNPANKAGVVFSDNTATWITRAFATTNSRGDVGEYTGGIYNMQVQVRSPLATATSSVVLDNLHHRAVGSATGWKVKGLCRANVGGPPNNGTADFATADLSLARDGLILNSSSSLLGAFIRTDKVKSFRIRKHFSAANLTASRMHVAPAGPSGERLTMTPAQEAYHRRVCGNLVDNGNGTVSEGNDGPISLQTIWVNDEVKNAYVGILGGSTACVLTGFTIAENPVRAGALQTTDYTDGSVQVWTPYGGDHDPRRSLGTPTIGHFQTRGETIFNASAVAGNTTPAGYIVTTAGILAPAWVTSTVYVKGQIIVNAGNAYAANGSFTSGTAPTGGSGGGPLSNGLNIPDGTATAIATGDVATWDFLAPTAVLTALANVP